MKKLVVIPDEVASKLKELKRKHGVCINWLINKAIEEYLQKKGVLK